MSNNEKLIDLREHISLHEDAARVAGRRVWWCLAAIVVLAIGGSIIDMAAVRLLAFAAWVPLFHYLLSEARNDGAASALRGLLR